MFSSSVKIKTVAGDNGMLGVIDAIEKASQPTVGDLLYAGQRQRTRILERTAKGLDYSGTAFHPYSSVGPYYYYPGKSAKNRSAAARSFANKIGLSALKHTKKGDKIRVLGVGVGQRRGANSAQRTNLGIKFSSYAAFKAYLGRTVVDLFGPTAPHMLQALIVKVGSAISAFGSNVSSNDLTPAKEIILGIYGQEAARADGHNTGGGHLPKRKFLGASDSDKSAVLNDILARIAARMRKALGGAR